MSETDSVFCGKVFVHGRHGCRHSLRLRQYAKPHSLRRTLQEVTALTFVSTAVPVPSSLTQPPLYSSLFCCMTFPQEDSCACVPALIHREGRFFCGDVTFAMWRLCFRYGDVLLAHRNDFPGGRTATESGR
eukprot:1212752-Rhodomonas_salina.1